MGTALGLASHGVLPEVAAQGARAARRGEIIFQSDREGPSRLFILDLATNQQRRVGAPGEWFDEDPDWSPDGQRIAFASTRAQPGGKTDIYIMAADGSQPQRLTDHPAADQDPAWAADGKSLFFTTERDGRGELYRLWIDTKRAERLTSGFARAIMPAVSPDGKHLAYAAQMLMDFQVMVMDLGTGTSRQVGTSGGACRPAFSPDSAEVAYVHMATEPTQLEAARESGRRTLLADPKLWVYYPSYSPDGRTIAFSVSPQHHAGEDWDLAIMDAATPGRFERLTAGRGNDRVPVWRPQSASAAP